jgi:hypothetical protein
MAIRSNVLSVKRCLVKWKFSQMNFRSNEIRSNGVRSNGVSVKYPFGQMVFRPKGVRSKTFGEMIFRQSEPEPVSPQKFRANFFQFGRNSPKSANSSAEQWTKFVQIGRNSPEIFEGEPQLRGFASFTRKIIYYERQTNTNIQLLKNLQNTKKNRLFCLFF